MHADQEVTLLKEAARRWTQARATSVQLCLGCALVARQKVHLVVCDVGSAGCRVLSVTLPVSAKTSVKLVWADLRPLSLRAMQVHWQDALLVTSCGWNTSVSFS